MVWLGLEIKVSKIELVPDVKKRIRGNKRIPDEAVDQVQMPESIKWQSHTETKNPPLRPS